jgi:hypothetical protein
MHPKTTSLMCAIGILMCVSLACSFSGAGTTEMIPEPVETLSSLNETAPEQPYPPSDEQQPGQVAPMMYETDFPLPEDVQNFTKLGEDQINFQTSISLQESMSFYRTALVAKGLTERDLLTEMNETVFSMVFDGDPKGAIVVQGVDLGNGTTNINIRYEDV